MVPSVRVACLTGDRRSWSSRRTVFPPVAPTPLLEEYATARHAFALSSVDLCEIARSSCVSAFSDDERNDLHNDDNINNTNVPNIRLTFREKTLAAELKCLRDGNAEMEKQKKK